MTWARFRAWVARSCDSRTAVSWRIRAESRKGALARAMSSCVRVFGIQSLRGAFPRRKAPRLLAAAVVPPRPRPARFRQRRKAGNSMFEYVFMQRGLVVGILLGIIVPLVGVTIVLRRLSMIGD